MATDSTGVIPSRFASHDRNSLNLEVLVELRLGTAAIRSWRRSGGAWLVALLILSGPSLHRVQVRGHGGKETGHEAQAALPGPGEEARGGTFGEWGGGEAEEVAEMPG